LRIRVKRDQLCCHYWTQLEGHIHICFNQIIEALETQMRPLFYNSKAVKVAMFDARSYDIARLALKIIPVQVNQYSKVIKIKVSAIQAKRFVLAICGFCQRDCSDRS